jgi:plasmid stability protein
MRAAEDFRGLLLGLAISIDGPLEAKLRAQAAAHNTSIEDEVVRLLRAALFPETAPDRKNLAQAVRDRFEPLGGVELDLDWIRKLPMREPPTFD